MNTGTTKYAEDFYSNVANDIDTLEKNVRDYPASSIARFLLLYSYKKNGHPGFEELAKQTSVFFNNCYWLQYQLSQAEYAEDSNEKENKEEEIVPAVTNEPIIIDTVEDNLVNEEHGEEQQAELKEDEIVATVADEPITIDTAEDDLLNEEVNDELQAEVKEEEIVSAVADEPIIIDTAEDDWVNKEHYDEQQAEVEEEIVSTVTEEPMLTDAAGDNLKNEESIAFEPLHTIDYFASQGIKISTGVLESDRFGKQVKSFTAWLKSMKKLHPGQLPEQNEVIEKIIQSSSEVSNQNANVLTEAMAEVLMKQGKKEKAIEMYQKLSLMNPSKNTYFATKIESLKHN